MKNKYTAHPWHGIAPYNTSKVLQAFIEIVPTDTVKYEVDKDSGFLKLDRPQKFSNIIPALYGFIPQTYCAENVADYCMKKTGYKNIVGDGDPLDICVLTEKNITHGNLLVPARPIGGFRMIDRGEADDKIIAVLDNDDVYVWNDISECPESLINRLKHYFLTYKQMPLHPNEKPIVEITHIYGAKEAQEIIEASFEDYRAYYTNDKIR
ncbi:MAG: inorganic pyrophosphatase [Chitinophagales bacterium]|nr:inorganic pyrophosphatase [Chitinophagales bacterium]